MKLTSRYLRILTGFTAFLALCSQAIAQPAYAPGYHWAERALAYAEEFCSGTNPEYGRFSSVDCADFTSQIANAGCSGMCESNDTNWPGWTAPDSTCWAYHSTEPHSNRAHGCNPNLVSCVQCRTGQHLVISNASSQSYWFYCSDSNFVEHAENITDSLLVPFWVGKGCFAFLSYWNASQQICKWHAVFIGSGAGSDAIYYAHSAERCGEHAVTWLYTQTGFHHMEFYKPRIFSPTEERK
jgi:hypothetical protein